MVPALPGALVPWALTLLLSPSLDGAGTQSELARPLWMAYFQPTPCTAQAAHGSGPGAGGVLALPS